VALLHGYAEHAGRYGHVQRAWAERRISSVAVDLRGHGRSEGRRGFVERFEDYHHDVRALLEAARARARGGPLALFGHSNGGLLAAHWLIHQGSSGLQGAILSSPFLGLGWRISARALAASDWLARRLPKLDLPAKLENRHLCRDPQVLRLRDRDPLILRRANARWFREARRAQAEVFERAGEIGVPLLVLQGGADRIADPDATERFAARLTGGIHQAERLPGMYHELVNEPERDAVITRMGDWLVARAREAGSGTESGSDQ
jgi:alpha-beta hydrolase superfamily lysophospholipase